MFIELAVIVILSFGVIRCLKAWGDWLPSSLVQFEQIQPMRSVQNSDDQNSKKSKKLFVLIHGYRATSCRWQSAKAALEPHGDVLPINYPSFLLSNADPEKIAEGISRAIETREQSYDEIILVGHSMGALITRRAFLCGCAGAPEESGVAPSKWATKVERIVLLAGMNRGWDIDTKKPMDMSVSRYHLTSWSTWFAETTGIARLARDMQAGSPFVANLRLEWMRHFRKPDKRLKPLTVQLLGDIDDTVSEDDNKDLAGTASSQFLFLRVRGTGHSEIIDFTDSTSYISEESLGDYRKEKFLLATVKPPEEIHQQREVQSFGVDPSVKHLVFVVHGIRDYGNWSHSFETAIKQNFAADRKIQSHLANQPITPEARVEIASSRYGYFGMGPFLLRSDRQKYVRWLMDEYTETVAKYPELELDKDCGKFKVDFVGHSNGTYLLATALKQYRSLQVRRVVFGGSVVRQDYPWSSIMPNQVAEMRNYVAADDWVVGLLPRVFEPMPFSILNPDVGSAGFNGFKEQVPRLKNIKYLTGEHGAFLHQIPAIADFVIKGSDPGNEISDQCRFVGEENRCATFGRWLLTITSNWGTQLLWAFVLVLVVAIGFGVRQFGLPCLAAYLAFLLLFLTRF